MPIDLRLLRPAVLKVLEAIRQIPSVRKLPNIYLLGLLAYMMGVVMRGSGMEMRTLEGLRTLVQAGFDEFTIVESDEGREHP